MALSFKDVTSDYCGSSKSGLTSFSRLVINDQLCIGEGMPPLQKILSFNVDYNVLSTKLIKTPYAMSIEGQTLTGYKVLVELELNQKVVYESSTENCLQSAVLKSKSVKSVYVVVPETYKGQRVCDLIRTNSFLVNPITEFSRARIIDNCCMLFYASVIVDIQLY